MNGTRLSKTISFLLRHAPDHFDVVLDAQGWASVTDVVAGLTAAGFVIDRAQLASLVADSDKQRFALSADGTRIRANQGHSVEVDLGLDPAEPPKELFHGTTAAALSSIRAHGIRAMSRQLVHLSKTREVATQVGSRRGKPVILLVHAQAMQRSGYVFYEAINGVWLTATVPTEFLVF